jgi:ribosome assembly protein YihI (activator of Der GTPase)
VEPARRKKKRKTQDYMAKHSEDGSRTSREELAGNKSSEQEQDPMASFHKGPMPLRGVKGHTTPLARKAENQSLNS